MCRVVTVYFYAHVKLSRHFCPTQFFVAKSVLESGGEKQTHLGFWLSRLSRK